MNRNEDFISILSVKEETTVDGPGLRTAIYSAGCAFRCSGCHNPQSWNIENGRYVSIHTLLQTIVSADFSHVTFTGGDPFFQVNAFTKLARLIKEKSNKNIWCYTGHTFEEIMLSREKKIMLPYIDVLVDGQYIQEKRDKCIKFRGSTNQRLINVKPSLVHRSAILF